MFLLRIGRQCATLLARAARVLFTTLVIFFACRAVNGTFSTCNVQVCYECFALMGAESDLLRKEVEEIQKYDELQ